MTTDAPMSDAQWWLEPEGEKHTRMLALVKDIRQNQGDRKFTDLLNATLYAGARVSGFGFGSSSRAHMAAHSRPALNVVRNMVGAVTSKIAAKNKPKPTFLTEDGNYELREKAEMLEKFVSGVFYESGVYAQLCRCFRDAAVYGTGVLKISEGTRCVDVEGVSPLEIVVDDGEAHYRQPRNIYHRRYYDRLVARETWGSGESEEKQRIWSALSTTQARDPEDTEFAYRTTADQVLITEGWHLGENDSVKGRHVIAIEGCTLLDEEWDGPFPFALMRWSEPLEGFFGIGLAEELVGIQREINRLLMQIQRGHHLIAGHWLVENGSKVSAAMLNNDLAAIVKYSGTQPTYNAPQIIAPEVYAHLWQLYAKAFEISGISQLNATGQKPAGLDSGEAQRVYQDIQTERFLEVGQAYEEFVVEAARQVVRCAKRIGGDYRVSAVDKGKVEFVSIGEIDISEDLYVIRVYPTSLLPTTPAGKLAWAQDMIQSKMIPADDALEILDFPDTQAYANRRLAPRKLIERNVASIIRKGKYITPEPFDDHALALRIVNESYHDARLSGVPEEKLEMLRRYMSDTADFLGTPIPSPTPAPMAPVPPVMMPPEGPLPGMPLDPALPPPVPMAA